MAYPITPLRIEVLATGNELLDGTIADTNSQELARALMPLGLKISRTNIVPDDPSEIKKAVTEAAIRSDVIIISGGLGPTTDDLTLETVAQAFGSKLILDRVARKNVMDRLKLIRRRPLNPSNQKQFFIPKGSRALVNKMGTAPGVRWDLGDRTLFFLPGVPQEFRHLLQLYLLPFFEERREKTGEFLFILKTFGWPESGLNELMKSVRVPKGISIGYRTHLPENHLKLQVRAPSRAEALRIAKPLIKKLKQKLGDSLFAADEKSFAESVLDFLARKKWMLAAAESCTGGLVASLLTKVSGSSAYFERGYVTYSNRSKQELLGVSEETLKKFGAVSEQVVREMAIGALKRARVDASVAITGIAGPTGGTQAKPVGTVWVAAASKKKILTKLLHLPFDREQNQKFSAYHALHLLKKL